MQKRFRIRAHGFALITHPIWLQASLTKGHAREGSYINKSLLTLGTVIGKLSDGNAVHIPFRDSKLTRLLQSSMTGSAARISVIATATPASCQAEETHNTLKFATRAKKVGEVCILGWGKRGGGEEEQFRLGQRPSASNAVGSWEKKS